MPKAWSEKDEREYQHIKKSAQQRGKGKRASEIAARTVNQQRRKRGATPNRTSQGVGNPNHSLTERTHRELYNRARQLDIAGRSTMNKQELVRAIRRAG